MHRRKTINPNACFPIINTKKKHTQTCVQQRANKQTITINKKGQRPSIFANRSIFFKTKSREPIKLRVGQNAMLWLAVGISDRCLHKNANLQTGLRVSMITPIFLKSADLELPISRPPQDFFLFFQKNTANSKHSVILITLSTYTTCAHFVYFLGACDWHPRDERLRNSWNFQNPIISSGFKRRCLQNLEPLDEINL